MTVIGTPIIQSTADRMARLLSFADLKRLQDKKVPLRQAHSASSCAAGRPHV